MNKSDKTNKMLVLSLAVFMLGFGNAYAGAAATSLPMTDAGSAAGLPNTNVGKAEVPADWTRASILIKQMAVATPDEAASSEAIQDAANYADTIGKQLVEIAKRNVSDEKLFQYIVKGLTDVSKSANKAYYQSRIFRNLAAIVSYSDSEKVHMSVIDLLVRNIGKNGYVLYSKGYVNFACGIAEVSTEAVRMETAKKLLNAMKPEYNKDFVRFVQQAVDSLLAR